MREKRKEERRRKTQKERGELYTNNSLSHTQKENKDTRRACMRERDKK